MSNGHIKLTSLCVLLLIAFLIRATSGGGGSNSNARNLRHRLPGLEDEDAEVINPRSNSGEDAEDEEDEANTPSGGKSVKTAFTWDLHPEDHGIYAHRSLMSAEDVKHPLQDEPSTSSGLLTDHSTSQLANDEYEPLKMIDYAENEWQLMFRSIDLMFDNFANSMSTGDGKKRKMNFFEEVVSRLKPECRRDIDHIRESVKKHKLWALRMLDSNGKLPSGITYGRFSSPGDYEECLDINVDESVLKRARSSANIEDDGDDIDTPNKLIQEQHKFHGKYCLIDFRLPLPERPRDKLLSIHDPVLDLGNTEIATKFPSIKNYSGYASMFYEVGYMHGFCLPSTCDIFDVTKSLGISLEGMYIIVNNTIDCEERLEAPLPLTGAQIISLTFLTILFINATVASIVHHVLSKKKKQAASKQRRQSSELSDNEHDKSKLQASSWTENPQTHLYSDCFSVQTNFERLTKPDPRGMTFVHYTRIVAMALTVITHTAAMGTLQAITKPADASNNEQIFRDFLPQMLANAFTSIQIFFFMAGFMLVISTYPSIKRERGHISFVEYAIKRAIRLMPGLAATIALNFLWPLISEGPMLTYFKRMIVEPCENNWWRTLGFLSNFDHVEKMCIRHSYFSASDYQLHLMAFPLLILLHKQPLLSLIIAGLLTAVGFTAQVIVILTKTVLPFMMVDYIDKEAFFNVVHYIHHPVWNHMSAFFYGFIIGYFVVKQTRINMSQKTVQRIWTTIIPLGFISIFAPYFWNHYKRPIHKWQMVLYVLFDRSILLTTCAWLAYASMVLGRKPPAKPKSTTTNLPDIVSLEKNKAFAESAKSDNADKNNVQVEQPRCDGLTAANGGGLSAASSSSSLKRQRSSPNFLSSRANEDHSVPALRPAASNVDLTATNQTANETTATDKQALQVDPAAISAAQMKSKKRCTAPVSNVNILCLVLSRLTFQLYLFNMVVLWVDVTNSKYFWFFSYYFIITKAFAVYIGSTLMAMIFFVTLESPCLTLYINWVKSRAQSRADRKTAHDGGESPVKEAASGGQNSVSRDQEPKVNENVGSVKSQSGHSSPKSPDTGLYMRVIGRSDENKSVAPGEQPTFSFIDLSAPSATTARPNINCDATRM